MTTTAPSLEEQERVLAAFLRACHHGDAAYVRDALERSASASPTDSHTPPVAVLIAVRDANGFTPFLTACRHLHVEVALALLAHHPKSALERSGEHANTPMLLICSAVTDGGDIAKAVALVRELGSHGHDPRQANAHGETALLAAVLSRRVELVQAVLDVLRETCSGVLQLWKALHSVSASGAEVFCAAATLDSPEVLRVLLEVRQVEWDRVRAAVSAMKAKKRAKLRKKQPVCFEALRVDNSQLAEIVLYAAALAGAVRTVQWLVDERGVDVYCAVDGRDTPVREVERLIKVKQSEGDDGLVQRLEQVLRLMRRAGEQHDRAAHADQVFAQLMAEDEAEREGAHVQQQRGKGPMSWAAVTRGMLAVAPPEPVTHDPAAPVTAEAVPQEQAGERELLREICPRADDLEIGVHHVLGQELHDLSAAQLNEVENAVELVLKRVREAKSAVIQRQHALLLDELGETKQRLFQLEQLVHAVGHPSQWSRS